MKSDLVFQILCVALVINGVLALLVGSDFIKGRRAVTCAAAAAVLVLLIVVALLAVIAAKPDPVSTLPFKKDRTHALL